MFYVFYTFYWFSLTRSLSLSLSLALSYCARSVSLCLSHSLSLSHSVSTQLHSFTRSLGVGLFYVTHTHNYTHFPTHILSLPTLKPYSLCSLLLCLLSLPYSPHTLSFCLYQNVANSFSISISLPTPCRSNKS